MTANCFILASFLLLCFFFLQESYFPPTHTFCSILCFYTFYFSSCFLPCCNVSRLGTTLHFRYMSWVMGCNQCIIVSLSLFPLARSQACSTLALAHFCLFRLQRKRSYSRNAAYFSGFIFNFCRQCLALSPPLLSTFPAEHLLLVRLFSNTCVSRLP